MKYKKIITSVLAIFLLLSITASLQFKKPKRISHNVSSEAVNYTLSPTILSILSLGQEKLISSYLWMNTLLFSDHEHIKEGNVSWMSRRFDLISKFNPKFYENYYYGGIYLSIIKDDVKSAEELFKSGLKHFIDHPDLMWNRAFNLCFELKKCKESLPLYIKLRDKYSMRFPLSGRIAAKIQNGLGLEEESFLTLYETYKVLPAGPIKESTQNTLYDLRRQIDLKCLNSKKRNSKRCNKKDFFGNSYIYKNGIYSSKLRFNEKLKIQ